MKRRISQGQAMRSTFGRARVTHTVRPFSSRGGSLSVRTSSSPAFFQASKPPSERLRVDALVAQPGGRAFAQLLAALANDDDASCRVVLRPSSDGAVVAAQRAGSNRGSAR